MPTKEFNRDRLARWYARQHLKVDLGVREIYYLPLDAPEREIRLLEFNDMIADFSEVSLEPFDFGVDTSLDGEHKLVVLDITPRQWEKIQRTQLSLPTGWQIEGAI